jgi:hypothetical protein
MLRQAHASWAHPRPFTYVDDGFRREMVRVMEYHLQSRRRRLFLGKDRYPTYMDIRILDFPWGWKDPRNTFTIVVWKELFPQSKIIHVYRNPMDVAESLKRRELKKSPVFKKWLTLKNGLNIKEIFLRDIGYYDYGYFLKNLDAGIELWKAYVERALRLGEEGLEVLHVKYEDVLEAPIKKLREILDFISLTVDENLLAQKIENIDVTRRYAFIKNRELYKHFAEIKDLKIMKKLGYAEIDDDRS